MFATNKLIKRGFDVDVSFGRFITKKANIRFKMSPNTSTLIRTLSNSLIVISKADVFPGRPKKVVRAI